MTPNSILFYRDLYIHNNKNNRSSIKIEIRLADELDGAVFEEAVIKTMRRYPYYAVTLGSRDGEYFYMENNRPVVIRNDLKCPCFNTEETNGHFVAFGYEKDRLAINMFHGLTDGTGVYEVLKTLLYYYCEKRYGEHEAPENVRLAEDIIKEDEWFDPYKDLKIRPLSPPPPMRAAVDILRDIPKDDNTATVYHLSIPEKDFMDFCVGHDSTPGTMVGLLLSRIINRMYPEEKGDIRFLLCTNDRKFLGADKTCFNMVGILPLEYKPVMRNWPLDRQATAYRGMVFANTYEEYVIKNAIGTKMLCTAIKEIRDHKKRVEFARQSIFGIADTICGMISYVGKTYFPNASRYIKDFCTLAEGAAPFGVEISTADGCFKLDIIQQFKDMLYVKALREELGSFGICSELTDCFELELSRAALPWLNDI